MRSTSVGVTTPMAFWPSSTTYTLRAGSGGRRADGLGTTLPPNMRRATGRKFHPAQTQSRHAPGAHPPVLVMVHQLADGCFEGGLRSAGDQRGPRQRLAPPPLLHQHTCEGKQLPLLLLLLIISSDRLLAAAIWLPVLILSPPSRTLIASGSCSVRQSSQRRPSPFCSSRKLPTGSASAPNLLGGLKPGPGV
jgi:hypothetical protein